MLHVIQGTNFTLSFDIDFLGLDLKVTLQEPWLFFDAYLL